MRLISYIRFVHGCSFNMCERRRFELEQSVRTLYCKREN